MGTWIETRIMTSGKPGCGVVPLVGTWIETADYELWYPKQFCVVPLVGTWIETLLPRLIISSISVVPLVGTWIETILVIILSPPD